VKSPSWRAASRDGIALDQFEQRQESHHHFQARRILADQIVESGCFSLLDSFCDQGDLLADGDPGGGDDRLQRLLVLLLGEDGLGRLQQVGQRDVAHVQPGIHLRGRGDAQVSPQSFFLAIQQQVGDFLEALVDDQLARQRLAQVFLARFAYGRSRQQRLGFDLQQPGCHHQEGRDFVGWHLHGVDVGQVLVSDLGQRHGGDVQFGVLDELQQQVERPFVHGYPHSVPAGLAADLSLPVPVVWGLPPVRGAKGRFHSRRIITSEHTECAVSRLRSSIGDVALRFQRV